MEYWLFGIGGLLLGGIVAWVLLNARARAAQATLRIQLDTAERRLAENAGELAALRTKQQQDAEALRAESQRRAAAEQTAERVPVLETKLAEVQGLRVQDQARLAELETRIVEERKAAQEKLAFLNDAQQKLSDAFKALSSDALKNNNQSFLELARLTLEKFHEGAKSDLEKRQKAVDEMVKPIRESLEKVDGKLGEIEKARVGAYAELSTQVKGLIETHLPMLRNETANLVKALRQPTVRGRWGEMQLRRCRLIGQRRDRVNRYSYFNC
jgi:DNA recombination protein RmuC